MSDEPATSDDLGPPPDPEQYPTVAENWHKYSPQWRDFWKRQAEGDRKRSRGEWPPDDLTERCLCPFCDGTGAITTPMPIGFLSGEPQTARPGTVVGAALRSKGFWSEELQGHAADCLSHLPDDVSAARESLINYLWYLRRDICHADQDICEVIEMFQYAVIDLQNGVETPLFAAEKKARAKPQLAFEALICASAAITSLMDKGKSEDEAAKMVAKKLKDWDLPLPDSYQTRKDHVVRPDWQRLQEWRRKCSSGRRGEWAKSQLHEWDQPTRLAPSGMRRGNLPSRSSLQTCMSE